MTQVKNSQGTLIYSRFQGNKTKLFDLSQFVLTTFKISERHSDKKKKASIILMLTAGQTVKRPDSEHGSALFFFPFQPGSENRTGCDAAPGILYQRWLLRVI